MTTILQMKLIAAAILSTIWLFGGGYLFRWLDQVWRKWPRQMSGAYSSRGFDAIISKLYVDATQLQDRPYVERSENPTDPR